MANSLDGARYYRSGRGLPIIGVMGSGSVADESLANEVGRWLATLPVHLLTGGGSGMMEAVSRAFYATTGRSGMVLGVLPGNTDGGSYRAMEGYPNEWIEIPIRTHLPLSGNQGFELASRNHINVLTADIVIALPGSQGTASEVRLALQYDKPLIVYLPAGSEIPDLPAEAILTDKFTDVKSFVTSHLRSLDLH